MLNYIKKTIKPGFGIIELEINKEALDCFREIEFQDVFYSYYDDDSIASVAWGQMGEPECIYDSMLYVKYIIVDDTMEVGNVKDLSDMINDYFFKENRYPHVKASVAYVKE